MNPEIGAPVQEIDDPEPYLERKFDKLFYLLGKITHVSRSHGRETGDAEKIERSLMTRTKRAQLLKEFKSIPQENREARQAIIDEANIRDGIAEKFLSQGEIKVTLPGMGEQMARYNRIPANEKNVPQGERPDPIVIIPGISNDLVAIGEMSRELAYMGRDVISIGYPESYMGKVTPEFADAVEKNNAINVHADFFKEAVKGLVPEGNIELWGASTGGPIAAEILGDEQMQERVSQAVFVAPAGSVNQSKRQMAMGIMYDMAFWLKTLPRTAMTVLPSDRRPGTNKKVTRSLMKIIRNEYQNWGKAKVRSGGKVTVVNGGKDQVTKSYLAEQTFRNNNFEVISSNNDGHTSIFNNPEVLRNIFASREQPQSSS